MKYFAPLMTCALLVLFSCDEADYTPMQFSVQDSTIVAEGVIDGGTKQRLMETVQAHPDATTLILAYVGGSVDDDANLDLGRYVRSLALKTVVPADGMVASGGTDLFLAGASRELDAGACVGVHSWSDGTTEGRAFPKSDPQHQMYLEYYDTMGVPRDFYWFTLDAAPADGMHWMTASQAATFQFGDADRSPLSNASTCDQR